MLTARIRNSMGVHNIYDNPGLYSGVNIIFSGPGHVWRGGGSHSLMIKITLCQCNGPRGLHCHARTLLTALFTGAAALVAGRDIYIYQSFHIYINVAPFKHRL